MNDLEVRIYGTHAKGFARERGVGAFKFAVKLAVPGLINTGLVVAQDGFQLEWTNNVGQSGSYNLSGNGNQPSNWINPDALAAIVEADMNHQYVPLYRELEGHVEPLGLYPQYCYGCIVGPNGETGDFALGPITVGLSAEIAYPEFMGKYRGWGISAGLAADNRANGIGWYVTTKRLSGTYDVMLSISGEVTYSHPTGSNNLIIDHLNGSATEWSGGLAYGGSYSIPRSDQYRQYGIIVGIDGLHFGAAKWTTNTTINPWFY